MAWKSIYVPLSNLSFNAGKLNPAGLTRADGVVHAGASYAPTPPLFVPTDGDFTGVTGTPAPVIAHVNLSKRADSGDFTIFVYCNKTFYKIDGLKNALSWPISAVGTVDNGPGEQQGGFVSFGRGEVFAAGTDDHVQFMGDGDANFSALFTSVDKPKAAYVAGFGPQLVFGYIGNPGSAGATPDPNGSLVWWGAINAPDLIGNVSSLPKELTSFQPLNDDFGDVTGIASGLDTALIAKTNAFYKLSIGGAYGFEVPNVAVGIGLEFSHSMVQLGPDTYFYSTMGPAVFRDGEVRLLGEGAFALREMFGESPADPELSVISAAADLQNGLVCWLVTYKSLPYTYALDADGLPTETAGAAELTYALLVYNVLVDQLSFAWKVQASEGIQIVQESAPSTARRYIPLCLVDRIPWQSPLPLAGIGMIVIEDASTLPEGDPNLPRLLLFGLPSTTFTPQWLVAQNVVLTTGFIPFVGQNVRLMAVEPILRSRRSKIPPGIRVTVRVAASAHAFERQYGPFDNATYGDRLRNGLITTPGIPEGGFLAIDLELDYRTVNSDASVSYAYLVSEIEGLNLLVAPGGQRR